MKVKCKYCGSEISDTDEKCPYCTAPNDELKRVGNGVPKTIDELKTWYVSHNLPDENITRFFIGKDYKEPRAFGIYHDTEKNEFVVYKNKADGTRAIRYSGKDETYAVNELYTKLKEEIANQKSQNHIGSEMVEDKIGNVTYYRTNEITPLFLIQVILSMVLICTITNYATLVFMLSSFIIFLIGHLTRKSKFNKLIVNICCVISFFIFLCLLFSPVVNNYTLHKNDAYYTDKDYVYYHYGDSWYQYNGTNWITYDGSTSSFDYLGDDYGSYNATDFSNSGYYDDTSTWDLIKDNDSSWSSSDSDDWDSSSSWDSSDSWDSGSSDWDSDW